MPAVYRRRVAPDTRKEGAASIRVRGSGPGSDEIALPLQGPIAAMCRFLSLVCASLMAVPVVAQEHGADAPSIAAAQIEASMTIDGRLDELVWEAAEVADRFVQREPDELEPATEPTRVLLMAGAPLGEPVAASGPFVMNTSAQLFEAMRDYQTGAMGTLTEKF